MGSGASPALGRRTNARCWASIAGVVGPTNSKEQYEKNKHTQLSLHGTECRIKRCEFHSYFASEDFLFWYFGH